MTDKLLKLLWKAIPGLSKLWKLQDGRKTWLGAVITAAGVGALILGAPEAVAAALVLDGVHQIVNGLAHKANKVEGGKRDG